MQAVIDVITTSTWSLTVTLFTKLLFSLFSLLGPSSPFTLSINKKESNVYNTELYLFWSQIVVGLQNKEALQCGP